VPWVKVKKKFPAGVGVPGGGPPGPGPPPPPPAAAPPHGPGRVRATAVAEGHPRPWPPIAVACTPLHHNSGTRVARVRLEEARTRGWRSAVQRGGPLWHTKQRRVRPTSPAACPRGGASGWSADGVRKGTGVVSVMRSAAGSGGANPRWQRYLPVRGSKRPAVVAPLHQNLDGCMGPSRGRRWPLFRRCRAPRRQFLQSTVAVGRRENSAEA